MLDVHRGETNDWLEGSVVTGKGVTPQFVAEAEAFNLRRALTGDSPSCSSMAGNARKAIVRLDALQFNSMS